MVAGRSALHLSGRKGISMIEVIYPPSRWRFSQSLMEMYHHRKRVFVDQLGWDLPAVGSWLEVDEFDNDYAVYLLARSPEDGSHLGSVRLLPTTQPHLLTKVFGDLCPGGPPTGSDCWEISRLVTNPATVRGPLCIKVHRLLAGALVDFAALNGVRRYTAVIELSRVPALLAVGWSVTPISMPASVGGQTVQALQINIERDTADKIRQQGRPGLSAPILLPEQAAVA
jgi:N-acyl-L-homoserine lactone synthetase